MRNKIRLILLAFFLTVLLFLTVKIFHDGKWDGMRRYTIVVNSEPLIVFSIEPATRRALFLTLPKNTLLDVPYGYNTYPAASVFSLGELEKRHGGGALLTGSIENTLGVMVDGFITKRDSHLLLFAQTHEHVLNIKSDYFSFVGLLRSSPQAIVSGKQVVTNLSFLDMIRLWNAVRSIRSDRIIYFDLEKLGVLIDEKLPDDSSVKTIDKDRFDALISDNFQDQKVRFEKATIEIVNASGLEKLASQLGRILTSLGANVIVKSTASVVEKYTCLIYISRSSLKNSIILQRILSHYPCQISHDLINSGQTEIKIILGEGFNK